MQIRFVPKVTKKPDTTTLRQLALDASVDYRTMQAVLEGRPVRGLAGDRARKALIEAGYLDGDSK